MSENPTKQWTLSELRRECEQCELVVLVTDYFDSQGVEPDSVLVHSQKTNGVVMSESDMPVINVNETCGEENESSPLRPNCTTQKNPVDVHSDSLNPSASIANGAQITKKKQKSKRQTVGGRNQTSTVKKKQCTSSSRPKRTNSRSTNTIKNHTGKRTSTRLNENKRKLNSFYSEIEREPEKINIEDENSTSNVINLNENTEHDFLENLTAQEMLITCVQYYRPFRERSKAIKIRLWSEIHDELKHKYEIKILENKLKYLKEEYAIQKFLQKSGFSSSKEWHHMKQLKFCDDISTNELTTSHINNVSLESDFHNVQRQPIEITKNQKSSQDNSWLLFEEQKPTKRKSPVLKSDDKFSQYLHSIMEQIPLAKRRKLQSQFINDTVNELNKLNSF